MQIVAGQHKEILNHFGETSSESEGTDIGRNRSTARNTVETRPPHEFDSTRSRGQTETSGTTRSDKKTTSHGTSSGGGETFATDYEEFYEVSKKEYFDFNEQTVKWAQNVRRRKTGQAYGKFKDDSRVYDLDIEDSTLRETPELQRRYDEWLARNFSSHLFATREDAEREEQLVRDKLLSQPPIVLDARELRRVPSGQMPAPPKTSSATANRNLRPLGHRAPMTEQRNEDFARSGTCAAFGRCRVPIGTRLFQCRGEPSPCRSTAARAP